MGQHTVVMVRKAWLLLLLDRKPRVLRFPIGLWSCQTWLLGLGVLLQW
jgi:hypothetical protein